MIKHKQHYVWRNYLRAWAKDEQIFCKRKDKIFKTNLENIANERDFYVINDLATEDIELVKAMFIDGIKNEFMKDINIKWIEIFDFVINFRKKVMNEGVPESIKNEFENTIRNFEEEMQSMYEGMGAPFLEKLKNGDTGFYYVEDSNIMFNLFIGMQYFRTKKMQTTVFEDSKGFPAFKVDKIWKLMAQIFATNIAASLYLDRNEFHPVLLFNQTNIGFIVGDQPIINTLANYKTKPVEPPTALEFYYPQSPSIALIITKAPDYYSLKYKDVSGYDVSRYNQMMADASEEQIYSNCEETLLKL
jgi:hypothetical protein